MFFEPADEGAPNIAVPAGQKVGLLLAGIAVLVVGIYPQPFIEFATRSIQMVAMVF